MPNCTWPGCSLIEDRQGYCFRHAAKLKIPKEIDPPYRMPKQSSKRKKEQPIYRKMIATAMDANPWCEVREEGCQGLASGMNHKVKRSPASWMKRGNLIRCCDSCNAWIEKHPDEAIEKGYSKSKHLDHHMDKQKNLWWGYKHTNGTYQAKRYFDRRDIDEARDSVFCETVVGPFEASDRDDALDIVKENTN